MLDAEKLVPAASRGAVDVLIEEIAIGEVYDLQERYGLLFDRSKTLALHLFEHVHGESRDRGQAMVDLKAMYENAGLVIAANELPDYVPLFLEFLSTQPLAEARELLGQTAQFLRHWPSGLVGGSRATRRCSMRWWRSRRKRRGAISSMNC